MPDPTISRYAPRIDAADLGALMRPNPFSLINLPALVPTPAPEPARERPNAEKFPTLAASGFIFAEAIDRGPVTRPACACPTCGRLTQRVQV